MSEIPVQFDPHRVPAASADSDAQATVKALR
jgi:hypothetical protein